MELREYLRTDFQKYIRNRIIKDKCEFCGSSEQLHLHHIDRFYNLLMETLQELNLSELDTDKYDIDDLKNIKYYMLAKQIQSEYKTLCKKCHIKLHFKENKSEEYKKYYYNPYGNFIYINFEKLKDIKLSNAELCHYIFICTFLKYNSDKLIIKVSVNKNRNMTEDDLKTSLSLQKTSYLRLKKVLLKEKLIKFDKDGIKINKNIVAKNNLNDKTSFIKVFCKEFQEVYNQKDNRELKRIGSLIRLSRYVNDHNLINISIEDITKELNIAINGLSRYIKSINENIEDKLIKKVDNRTFAINPRFLYKGNFTMEFKQVIEDYKSI